MSETLYCANHPDRETVLRCNKCGKPICPECAVRHPVGLRCRECAQLRRIPTYEVSLTHYIRAFIVGLLSSSVEVMLAGAVARFLYLPFLGAFLAAGIGLLVAEAIGWATGYKRGRGLQVVAGICVVLGYFIGNPLLLLITSYLLVGKVGFFPPLFWLNPYTMIYLLLATLFAVGRLR